VQLLHETHAHLPAEIAGTSARLHEHWQLHLHPVQALMQASFTVTAAARSSTPKTFL